MQTAPDVGLQHDLSLKRYFGVSIISRRDFSQLIWVTNTRHIMFVGGGIQF